MTLKDLIGKYNSCEDVPVSILDNWTDEEIETSAYEIQSNALDDKWNNADVDCFGIRDGIMYIDVNFR